MLFHVDLEFAHGGEPVEDPLSLSNELVLFWPHASLQANLQTLANVRVLNVFVLLRREWIIDLIRVEHGINRHLQISVQIRTLAGSRGIRKLEVVFVVAKDLLSLAQLVRVVVETLCASELLEVLSLHVSLVLRATLLGRVDLRQVFGLVWRSLDLNLLFDMRLVVDRILRGCSRVTSRALIVALQSTLFLWQIDAEVLLDDVAIVVVNLEALLLLAAVLFLALATLDKLGLVFFLKVAIVDEVAHLFCTQDG